MQEDTENTLYTVKEVAKMLKLAPKTIREFIQRGEIEALDMGQGYRIYKRDLDAFLESRRRKRSTHHTDDTQA